MPYKLGHCTQTGKELLIRNERGKFSAAKKDTYQAILVFKNGSKIKILLSQYATENPDLEKIYEELMHPAADSFEPTTRAYIERVYGKPIKLIGIHKHPFNRGV